MLVGIVDVGSNTIRMNIYRIENQTFENLLSKKEAVGLVAYIKKKRYTKEGMDALKDCLLSFKDTAQALHLDGFHVFATASLRNIENTEEVLAYIQKTCDVSIDLLSGEEEARLSFKGALSKIQFENGYYIDTGGGSTEIVRFKKKEPMDPISLPIGSLNLYQKYVDQIIPNKKETSAIRKEIENQFTDCIKKKKKVDNLTITGGSMRAIRSLLIRLDEMNPESYDIDSNMIHSLVDELLNRPSKEVIRLFLKVKADRVHTLFTGLLIVDTLLDLTQAKHIQVSMFGVREGYVLERILKQ